MNCRFNYKEENNKAFKEKLIAGGHLPDLGVAKFLKNIRQNYKRKTFVKLNFTITKNLCSSKNTNKSFKKLCREDIFNAYIRQRTHILNRF